TNGWATSDAVSTSTRTRHSSSPTHTSANVGATDPLDNADTDTNALAGGAGVSDNFTVFVKDGSNGTASTAVNFAITGTNDNPTGTADAQSAQPEEAGVGTAATAATSITLTKADPDTGDAAVYDGTALISNGWATSNGGVTYTQTGLYGTATLTTATGVVSYALNDAHTSTLSPYTTLCRSDNFTVFVKDGSNGTASTAVNFAITGTNDNPTVTAGAQSVQLVEAGVRSEERRVGNESRTKGTPHTCKDTVDNGTALPSKNSMRINGG